MIDATLTIGADGGEQTIELADYLDAAGEEGAHDAAYSWIKSLRHLEIDGRTFRERFTVRGDSLWWFSEIYLHRERAILDLFRAIAATTALIERERPEEIRVLSASATVRHVVLELAQARRVRTLGEHLSSRTWRLRLARLDWRARMLTYSALATRIRRGRVTARQEPDAPHRIAAFIHRAFWRSGGDDGSAESYIGPVLEALESSEGKGAITYVGVGPTKNFRARSLVGERGNQDAVDAIVPVEHYAPFSALRASRNMWRQRREHFRLLNNSKEIRRAAVIEGVDCWPVVREQLAGIAWLQWPWSVRAMDEAAAALDVLKPEIVLTYAEAGGWGRALMLEARRRKVQSVGLQHGFIYRSWLNYLHEPDEMQPGASNDAGFPAPTLTLLFDGYAKRHLLENGRFTPDRLRVTGSPRLDATIKALASFAPEVIESTRRDLGVAAGDALVLVTTKERQARHALPALLSAAEAIPNVTIVIKPHPAETADSYAGLVSGRQRVRVAPTSAPLAPLLAAGRVVVTVNSTVALDAAVAGIPALVIGLPNNLSPFVDAGVLAGAAAPEMRQQLERILYDEGFRQQLSEARGRFLHEHAIASTGTAAARSASAVIELMRHGRGLPGKGH
ncbi:hypothetical protein BH18ACI5_BH18ACI5_11930 [soil metagenome]